MRKSNALGGWLLAAFGGGAAIGWFAGGVVGSMVSALGATMLAGVVLFARRANDTARALDGPPPDIRGLEPKQALAVLGTVARGAGATTLDLDSPQGEACERIRSAARDDPSAGLALARELVAQFPRSGLVHGELAACLAATGDDEAATEATSTAIRLALDGGSNPLAVRLLVERWALRDGLQLAPSAWRRLGGAAQAAGDDEAAAWCRTRVDAPV